MSKKGNYLHLFFLIFFFSSPQLGLPQPQFDLLLPQCGQAILSVFGPQDINVPFFCDTKSILKKERKKSAPTITQFFCHTK